jgi:hypothetical protein
MNIKKDLLSRYIDIFGISFYGDVKTIGKNIGYWITTCGTDKNGGRDHCTIALQRLLQLKDPLQQTLILNEFIKSKASF